MCGKMCQHFLTCVIATCVILGATGSWLKSGKSNAAEWDHLVFAQQWPQANCEYTNSSGHHTCAIPSGVSGWTVHGIWPSEGSTKGPNYCDNSWPFDASKIQNLLPQMESQWPNLFTDTDPDSFWDHEWVKHGTCAASLPSIKGEQKYFSAGLSFNKKYSIDSALAKKGIVPSSSKTYAVQDVANALQDEFKFSTCLGCKYTRDLGQMLYQIYICLDKNLSIIDCPICQRSCRSYQKLVYHPLDKSSNN